MRPDVRRERIVGLLQRQERVAVDELANEFAASRETIRRDLTQLAERGLVRKFHGGAALPDANRESAFNARMAENLQEKRAIARKAAALFGSGDTLFVDTGTTTVAFAEELARLSGLTVITNSVTIAQTVTRSRTGNQAFLLGGEYREEAAENLGNLTVEQIGRFHAAHAVITVGAVEPNGAMDYDLSEAEVARAMISQARKITVLADSAKFHRTALFQLCPLRAIHRLVTDTAPSGPVDAAVREAGVDLILASDRP